MYPRQNNLLQKKREQLDMIRHSNDVTIDTCTIVYLLLKQFRSYLKNKFVDLR